MSSNTIDGKGATWSGINDSYLNRKRGSAASDVISSKTVSTWAENDGKLLNTLCHSMYKHFSIHASTLIYYAQRAKFVKITSKNTRSAIVFKAQKHL